MIAKSADDIRQKFISFVPPIATNAAYALDPDRARSIYGALRNVFFPNLNV
jgi:type IV secretory pathway VirB9-like protein